MKLSQVLRGKSQSFPCFFDRDKGWRNGGCRGLSVGGICETEELLGVGSLGGRPELGMADVTADTVYSSHGIARGQSCRSGS